MPVVMEQFFGAGAVQATIFFVALGLFQFVWIGVLLKSNNSSLLILGVLVDLFSILIYFTSTAGVTFPFGIPPQPLSPFAMVIKALEAVFVLASIYVMKNAGGSISR